MGITIILLVILLWNEHFIIQEGKKNKKKGLGFKQSAKKKAKKKKKKKQKRKAKKKEKEDADTLGTTDPFAPEVSDSWKSINTAYAAYLIKLNNQVQSVRDGVAEACCPGLIKPQSICLSIAGSNTGCSLPNDSGKCTTGVFTENMCLSNCLPCPDSEGNIYTPIVPEPEYSPSAGNIEGGYIYDNGELTNAPFLL